MTVPELLDMATLGRTPKKEQFPDTGQYLPGRVSPVPEQTVVMLSTRILLSDVKARHVNPDTEFLSDMERVAISMRKDSSTLKCISLLSASDRGDSWRKSLLHETTASASDARAKNVFMSATFWSPAKMTEQNVT